MSTIRLFLEHCNGIQRGQLLHYVTNRDKEDVLEVIKLLLNLGCPIDNILFQDDPRSWMEVKLREPGTCLFSAVKKGKKDIVVSRGADSACPSIRGRTPLEHRIHKHRRCAQAISINRAALTTSKCAL